MRAARSVGQPLSVVRGHRKPGARWSRTDRALLVALQAFEDDLCPGCGTPRTYGMDVDAAHRFEVHEDQCQGCASRDRAERADQNPKPGLHRYVTPDETLAYAMRHPIHVNPPPSMS